VNSRNSSRNRASALAVLVLLPALFQAKDLHAVTCNPTVTPSSATLVSGGQLQFKGVVPCSPENPVLWAATAGTISSSGLFTAPKVTQQTIVTVAGVQAGHLTQFTKVAVTVNPPALQSISVTPASVALLAGNSLQMTATGSYSDGTTRDVTTTASWTSSAPGVAAASGSQVDGLSAGSATISASLNGVSGRSKTTVTLPPPAIAATFFGLHENRSAHPAPVVSFGAFRFWDTDTRWSEIEKVQGQFDFSLFDLWASKIASRNITEAVFDLGAGTPSWASADPLNTNCDYNPVNGPGQCGAPKDLNPDGSGTDQMWKDWVTAIATHTLTSPIHIKYWEIWNEFTRQPSNTHGKIAWTGTNAQLVRMAQDARCIITGRGHVNGVLCAAAPIDPTAVIVSPSTGIDTPALRQAFASYYATPGASEAAEAFGIHTYTDVTGTCCAQAEPVTGFINSFNALLSSADQQKPLISTEGSWGVNTNLTDLDQEESFIARFHLLLKSSNIVAHYWYIYDNLNGTLWNPNGVNGCNDGGTGNGCLASTGTAYDQVFNWMVGASMSACTVNGTVYTCNFTRPGNYSAQAVWDSAQTCINGSCTFRTYSYPASMTDSRDLQGNTIALSGGTVQIGLKPILLENFKVF